MPHSEAETRQQIIDKRLAKAGWNVKDPAMVTEELDIIVDNTLTDNPKK